MFRINYVEVSVLAIFTSIALFFGTKNIPVSLTLAALSYFTLLAHALKCKSEKSMQEKEMVDHDLWNRIHEIENKLDAGPIYVQANIDLKKGDIAQILKNLSKICAQMMEEIIVKNLEPKKQKESKAFKPRLSESDSNLGRLDLNLQSIYCFLFSSEYCCFSLYFEYFDCFFEHSFL